MRSQEELERMVIAGEDPCDTCLIRIRCKPTILGYCDERIDWFNMTMIMEAKLELEIRRYENGDDT